MKRGEWKWVPAFARCQARAWRMIAWGKVRDAFDLRKPDKVRGRYGEGPVKHGSHPGPRWRRPGRGRTRRTRR